MHFCHATFHVTYFNKKYMMIQDIRQSLAVKFLSQNLELNVVLFQLSLTLILND